jgi:CRP-like cAMP-binding protein
MVGYAASALGNMNEHIEYYQRLIAEDPSHIDARLRLAAVWRELVQYDKSVEEFHAAARLLAHDGLVLEAMAACKAVFEMVPDHTPTQLFLASLYAQRPTSRVVEVIEDVSDTSQSSGGLIVLEAQDAVEELDVEEIELLEIDDDDVQSVSLVVNESPDDFTRTQELDIIRAEDVIEISDLSMSGEARALRRAAAAASPELGRAAAASIDLQSSSRFDVEPLSSSEEDDLSNDEALTRQIEALERPSQVDAFSGIADLLHESLRSNLHVQAQDSGEFTTLAPADDDGLPVPSWAPPRLTPKPDLARASSTGPVSATEVAALSLDEGAIPDTPLFSRLAPATLAEVLKRMAICRFEAGETIIEEGRHHRCIYVVLGGVVKVERQGPQSSRTLATLGRGDFFGEFELLTGRPPMVRVVAHEPVVALQLSQEVLAELAEQDPNLWTVLWEFYHERLLNNLLAGSSLFGGLDEEERQTLGREFRYGQVSAGTVIIRQGEPGAGLYLVLSGEVVVNHAHGEKNSTVARLRDGDFFGTVSSVTRSPSAATVEAMSSTTLLFLPRDRLLKLVEAHPEVEQALRRLVPSLRMWGTTSSAVTASDVRTATGWPPRLVGTP